MSKEKAGFDRYCGYRVPAGKSSDEVSTSDVFCKKDSKPCRIPCPYDRPSGVKSSVAREASDSNLPLREVQARIRRQIAYWGPSFLETLIEGIDQNPEFYEWLCETFTTKFPEQAKKFFFAGERFEEMVSSLDEELMAKATRLCDEVHNAETEPCLTDVKAYVCILNVLRERGVVTEEVQTTVLRFKKAPAPAEAPEKPVDRTEPKPEKCPTCGRGRTKCPDCGTEFCPEWQD